MTRAGHGARGCDWIQFGGATSYPRPFRRGRSTHGTVSREPLPAIREPPPTGARTPAAAGGALAARPRHQAALMGASPRARRATAWRSARCRGVRRQPCAPRSPAAHASDPPGGGDCVGLVRPAYRGDAARLRAAAVTVDRGAVRRSRGRARAVAGSTDIRQMLEGRDVAVAISAISQHAPLMQRSFGFDVLACPRCGGRFRLLAHRGFTGDSANPAPSPTARRHPGRTRPSGTAPSVCRRPPRGRPRQPVMHADR
jgi:hypothetical protein